jgi:RND superfamily putative drug exporter
MIVPISQPDPRLRSARASAVVRHHPDTLDSRMFDRLGQFIPRLRFVFAAAWLAAAVFFGFFGPSLSQVGSADETSFLPKDSPSLAAREAIAAAFPADSAPSQALIVFERPGGLTDADRAAIEGLRDFIEGPGHPTDLKAYVTAEHTPSLASMYRSSDGVIELARVDLSSAPFLPATNRAVDAVRAHLAEPGVLPVGLSAMVTGQAGIGRDYLKAIQDATDRTTIATIILVVVVLLVIYRAPMAAAVPLLTIGAAFLVARGLLGFLAQGGWRLSSVLDSFVVVLVFGVGTDYTIFLISRFREELTRHKRADAIRATVGRIGAVIAASAATVIVGLGSMIVASFGMIQTTGPALAIAIFVALLAGLTLAPSLLAIFGRRLFWPLHEQTREARADDQGFWATVGRRITERPGLIAGLVLVVLMVPLFTLPGLKQSFDVLDELPAGAESREGFQTLAAHLGSGQLLPLTVLVKVPGGDMSSSAAMAQIEALRARIAAMPGVGKVRSLVDPTGEGKVDDLVKPAIELGVMADGFRKPPSSDINVQLSDASLAGIRSTQAYVKGLPGVSSAVSGSTALTGAEADLTTLEQGLLTAREQALVANQLRAIADQIKAASGGATPIDAAAQIAMLKAYLDELGTAQPAVTSLEAYRNAQAAVASLAVQIDPVTGLALLSSLQQLADWFDAQPAPVYLVPKSIPASAESIAASQAMAAARARLPAELDELATAFGPNDLYAPPELVAAYVSADGDVTRMYVTTADQPYSTSAFDTVREMRPLLDESAPSFGSGAQAYLGGATAEFSDVQSTISKDFVRVAIITIVGILLVLILLLRAVVAPIYLVLTVLLSYSMSLSLSVFVLMHVFGHPGINYFIPLMVFVLLVALGSDYNIFLMARVREESYHRGLRPGIRVASARTGTVITSAGLILAGTFGSLVTSPLQLLFQVGFCVALGVLVDTFIVRSMLVPSITALVGEWAWWPFRRPGA